MKITMNDIRSFLPSLAVCATLLSCLLLPTATLASGVTPEQPVVGQVSLVLGKAHIKSPQGSRQPVKSGTPVRVLDEILTEGNGHVHIRFVDQALVSIRPDSRLEIQRYDYHAENPANSSVKLNLVEGVTRSISGEAARSARDRFRMNTPIAAIGVRGTDFVVSANRQTVRALVNEGAIVIAPFSNDCLADGFGPCAFNAVELTEAARQIIELNQSQELPQLLPLVDRIPELMRQEALAEASAVTSEAPAAQSSANQNNAAGSDLYLESVTFRAVTDQVNNPDRVSRFRPPQLPAQFMPVTSLAPQLLNSRQLVWGRWSTTPAGDDRIALNAALASDGRAITVGSASHGLFRLEPPGSPRVQAGLGAVAFNLNSAQAFFSAADGSAAQAMRVDGGRLEIDFELNKFATQLRLDHAATGRVDFDAAGSLRDGGYFHSRQPGGSMAGAVSLDGREAGYLFEKLLEQGEIQGLTLWGRQ